jgi:hypothetical protein
MILLWNEACRPGLVREWRIGDHVVVRAQLFPVLEFGIGERISGLDVCRREIMQDRVHAGETGGGNIFLLPFERNVLPGFRRDFQQQ